MSRKTVPYGRIFVPIRSPEEGGGQVLVFDTPDDLRLFAGALHSEMNRMIYGGQHIATIKDRLKMNPNYRTIRNYLQSSETIDDLATRFYKGLESSRIKIDEEYSDWTQAHSQAESEMGGIIHR